MADGMAEQEHEPGSDDPFISAVRAQIEEGLDRSGMYIYIIDRDCRFQYISSPAAQSLGRKQEEVIGRTPEEAGIPDQVGADIKVLVNATLEGKKAIQGVFKTNVRGEEQFEFDSTPIFAGGPEPVAVLALVFDRTVQAMERKALEAIARINDFVRSSLDPTELVSKTINAVSGALDDDAFALVIQNSGRWMAKHSARLGPEDSENLAAEAIRIASHFIDGGQAVAIEDAAKDQRFDQDAISKHGGGSALIIPVSISDSVKIVLMFVRLKVRPFTKNEISLGEKIASSMAVAIKDQLMLQELKNASHEREAMLTMLAHESEKLTSILDATPVSIGLFESDGKDYRLILCNNIFRNRVLLSVPRPLEGKRFEELARPEEIAVGAAMVERAFKTGQTCVSHDHLHNYDTFAYPSQLMITPLSIDPSSFLLVGVDISELVNARRQVEEYAARIETERARLRTMIDNLPVGVVLVDAAGKVLEANDKRIEIWGSKMVKEQIIDTVHAVRAKWSNNGMPVPKDGWPITRALKNGEFIKGEMVDVVRSDGRHGTELLSAAPIHDSKGKRIGAVGILQDVTEQRQLEHDALEAKERAEMYLDLLTHDIQGHNAAISGYIQLAMAKDKQGKKKDDLQKALDSITASTGLIDTMRKIQMVEMHDASHGQMELNSMLDEVIEDIKMIGGDRTHITKVTTPNSYTMASPMIREAFWNILVNSVKHSEGEVHISIRQNRSYDGGREYHKFIIEDDGPGIQDDVKPKVFLRKYRGRTKAQGSGLGLYLTKRLVEEHGGRIWVEDRVPGDSTKGARFIVHLPAVVMPQDQVENGHTKH
jgi:PAS domain S-box-containing protein